MDSVLHVHANGQIFGPSAVSVSGKAKLILVLALPTMYVAEQGFNQILLIRNKYRNRLDMNKT